MLVFGVTGAILLVQIKIAEWNPEKDLLAMVTEDSKILLHRFNWQRLWTTSPGELHFLHSLSQPFMYSYNKS